MAVGTRPVCVEAAKQYGATDIISYKNGAIEDQVLELTNGKGVDRVVIAGGTVQTFESAIKCLKPGGKIGSVNYLGKGEFCNNPPYRMGLRYEPQTDQLRTDAGGRLRMEKLGALVAGGKLDVKPLCTHVFSGWEKTEEALYLMKEKPADLIKPIVVVA